ncbi:MAG: hypothetical protein M3159_09920, partial [Actinomycetota bacterium]|nr:hypothetical protein [Actinomycetota bacterium]
LQWLRPLYAGAVEPESHRQTTVADEDALDTKCGTELTEYRSVLDESHVVDGTHAYAVGVQHVGMKEVT